MSGEEAKKRLADEIAETARFPERSPDYYDWISALARLLAEQEQKITALQKAVNNLHEANEKQAAKLSRLRRVEEAARPARSVLAAVADSEEPVWDYGISPDLGPPHDVREDARKTGKAIADALDGSGGGE